MPGSHWHSRKVRQMPTHKKPVHILADEMAVHYGPGAGQLALQRLRLQAVMNVRAGLLEGASSYPKAEFRLSTAASERIFVRNLRLTEIEIEYEDFLDGIIRSDTAWDIDVRPTGRFKLKGFIGDWYFTGVYDPKTRKGTLTEDPYDPELEAELDRIDGLEQEAIRRRGGL